MQIWDQTKVGMSDFEITVLHSLIAGNLGLIAL